MRYKGVVKEKVVLLEEGAHLPDGARVTVTAMQANQVEGEERIPKELAER